MNRPAPAYPRIVLLGAAVLTGCITGGGSNSSPTTEPTFPESAGGMPAPFDDGGVPESDADTTADAGAGDSGPDANVPSFPEPAGEPPAVFDGGTDDSQSRVPPNTRAPGR